ncbi:MAG TPA: hypothetical protein VN363_00205 [Anaerolineales bacterium]|nr:hypothetical protein [Anaerolineales bacterium]
MNHKPFEDWIFDPGSLADSNRADLHDHLEICEDCRLLSQAWEHVSIELHNSPLAEAAPGFAKRWQLRVEADTSRQHRRQSLLLLTFCILGAGGLLAVLALLTLPFTGSPVTLLMTWISRVWVLISTAGVIQDMLATLLRTLTSIVSPLWMILVLGIGSLIAVLWAASLRILLHPRRVTL